MRFITRALIILALSVLGLGTWQGAAAKSGNNTFYVGCGAGSYPTVQAAVDAAPPGATVYLCGNNLGPVVVSKSLTITGAPGATISAPTSVFPAIASTRLPPQFVSDGLFIPQSILTIWGSATNDNVSGITVAGPINGGRGCAAEEYGILVLAGANANLQNDTVSDIRDSDTSLAGCQFGNGIQVGREYWPTADFSNFLVENFVGTASITDTTVARYQKTGIITDGPDSSADIESDTVRGFGLDGVYSAIIAANGIQISRGADARVSDSTISDNRYTGGGYASASGVIVYGGCGDPLVTGVQIKKNTLTNNDVGISLGNYNADCTGPPSTLTNDQADHNTITNDAVTNTTGYNGTGAYQVGIEDIGNNDKIINNDISGAGYDPASAGPNDFIAPIDTTTFPTTKAHVHANR